MGHLTGLAALRVTQRLSARRTEVVLFLVAFQDHAANGQSVVTRAPAVVIAGLPAYWLFQPDAMTVLPGAVTAAALARSPWCSCTWR